jgi:hypothetical protein
LITSHFILAKAVTATGIFRLYHASTRANHRGHATTLLEHDLMFANLTKPAPPPAIFQFGLQNARCKEHGNSGCKKLAAR